MLIQMKTFEYSKNNNKYNSEFIIIRVNLSRLIAGGQPWESLICAASWSNRVVWSSSKEAEMEASIKGDDFFQPDAGQGAQVGPAAQAGQVEPGTSDLCERLQR